ncbi:hypothetical protein BH11BAC6_BH11BAC6_09650 [soil metagenome]
MAHFLHQHYTILNTRLIKTDIVNTDTEAENLKVLIVDDEMDICYLLRGILSRHSLHPYYVNTLYEAATDLEREIPSVVFLDNHLPDGLGIDFIKHIKSHYPSVKIALITAIDSTANKELAYKNGADFFISKPFRRETIFKVVNSIGHHPN